MPEGIITIKKGREKPIRNQHPWIFSGSIAKAENAAPGDIVTIIDHKGDFLARGYWNAKSQIQVRILTWENEAIDDAWWRKMLKRAYMSRVVNQKKSRGFVSAFRVVNAENDFLPGLIIDCYNNWLVLQALTLGIDKRKHDIARIITEVIIGYQQDYPDADLPDEVFVQGVYERSDVDVRGKEGLDQETGVLYGDEPPDLIQVQEENTKYLVDIRHGHKTGFYLDQRDNRLELLHFMADDFIAAYSEDPHQGHRVLNLFSYTGGFGLAALYAGYGLPGQITNVDVSREALELSEQSFALNFDGQQSVDYHQHVEFIQADVFDYLRDCIENGDEFDVVILDPPKFAHNKRQVDKASRGYKDINLNAFKVIRSGGYLMTFSCSGAISRDLFQKIVFGALVDSGRQAQIIKHLGASDDHPIALTFPEGDYLKGLLLRVY